MKYVITTLLVLSANALFCAEINQTRKYKADDLFAYAAEGNVDVVRAILKSHDVDVNAIDWMSKTALMMVSERDLSPGPVEVTKLLLLEPNLHINARDQDGWTALMWAAWQRRVSIVELLLAYPGISINVKDKVNGKTALDYAYEREMPSGDEDMKKIQGLLIDAGALTAAQINKVMFKK